jgi:hypothetical protein
MDALLIALAAAVSAIAAFFRVEVKRRDKQSTDLDAAFAKIRRIEKVLKLDSDDLTTEKTEGV